MAEQRISLRSSELATVVLPEVCARHGLPAAARAELALTVRKKRPHDPIILDTNIGGMAARAADQLNQEAVRRTDWPLCRRCASRRGKSLATAKILAVAGVVLIVAAVVLRIAGGQSASAGVLFGAGILAFPLALWAGLRSRVAAIVAVTLSQDRTEVTIHKPHEAFVRQWRERNTQVMGG